MGPFRVILKTYGPEGHLQGSEELVSEPAAVDTASMGSFFSGQGAAAARTFGKFLQLWESPECQTSLDPGACVAFVPALLLPGDLMKNLPGAKDTVGEEPSGKKRMAAAAVWTIGSGIDGYISGQLSGNDRLAGMMVDVAATLALNSMHRILRSLVKREASTRFGLSPVSEYCPGIGGGGMETIPGLIALTGAEGSLGLGFGPGMMRPVKSRCSVMLLEEGVSCQEPADRRCEPCLGEKCLYGQLGGCQMGR